MRPYVAELSRIASCLTSAHPNAGLPNAFGGYDETPDVTSALLHEFARDGFLNIAGSCCGSTPEHTKAISAAMQGLEPRVIPRPRRSPRFSGLEPFEIGEDTGFVLIGERTNVTGSARFRRLIEADDFNAAVDVALEQVRGGANLIDVNMDAGPARGRAGDADLPERDRHRAGGRATAGDGRQLEVDRARGGPAVPAGQGHRQLDLAQGRRGRVPAPRAPDPRLRRGSRRDGFRRGGPGHRGRAPSGDLRPRLRPAGRRRRLPARGHRVRPERARGRDGDRGARRLCARLPRMPAEDQGALPRRAHLGRHLEPQLLLPRQRRRPRGDARGVPLPRDSSRSRHGHRQRRAARGLRGHRARAQGTRRGRALQPAAGRDRAARRDRRPVPGRGDEAGARPAVAGGAGRASGSSTRSCTGSSTSSRTTPRRRARRPNGRST